MQKNLWVIGLSIIMFSGFAQAQSNKVLSIPAQNLPDALHSLSSQTGIQILFTAEQLKGFQSPAINGSMNTEQALIRLLQGTSYTWLASGQNTYVIKSAAEVATVMPEVRVTGAMDPDTPGNPSYTRTNASTAIKSNLPLIKTPVSVQVVPRAVMEDQQAVQVEDAIRNVSGVFPGFTFGGMSQAFMIRGFDTGFASFRDGFRFPLALRFSLANIERVEVLKGAASNLYGRIEPGGMVNLITKRPQAERYYSLNQQFGSYGQFQTLADATGALNETGTLLYRLNFEYLNQDSFRDFGFNKRIFVAPSVTWRITPDTQLDVDFTYNNEDTREDHGIVAIGNRPAKLPSSRFLGEPADKTTQNMYNTAVTLTHAFNSDWQARARFNYLRRDTVDPQTTGFDLNEATGDMQRSFYGGTATGDVFMSTVDITGRFYTAGVEHNVLAGWEYYGQFGSVKSISVDASPINIFRPIYSNVNLASQPYNFFIDQKNEWNGVYLQDQITLFDKLHIMAGGRYDWASNDVGTAFGIDKFLSDAKAAGREINNNRFSPRAGIVYQPWEWLSFYGNYVQSLGAANSAFDVNGNILKPQIGEQFEGGFKTSFFEGRLNSNFAYYHLTKQNLAFRVPGQPYSTPIGQARSQGVEVDVSGQVTRGLDLILTYAYTDAEVLEGNNKGNRLWNVPKHAGSLWARYDMQYEPLRGLSVGVGVYAMGKRLGDTANTFVLPAQTRVDAMVRYRPPAMHSRLSLQLNIYNLADSTLYGGTLGDRFSVNVDAPRTFIGSIRYEM
ncbi:TonB-dependent siderophore receptor [Nitrosomonas europaea]|uniref:TonB-dependent siderophore receptor n=2 Tax=Nitrosomonas europaea TaxID=915 RepID=UPI002D0C4FB3|nr:TonB-dependent receptor [Nitrosomonas europaea]HRN82827.1 TonB-dependent receptor [Nitrosomonas europaea]